MTVIATALKHLLAAGMTGDALVAAIAEIEAAQPRDAAADRRREKDRIYQAEKRSRRQKSAESADNADAQVPPNDIYSNPPPIPLEISDEISPPIEIDDGKTGEPPLTADEILDAWNDTADRCGLPKAKLTPQRRRKLVPLIRQHGLDDFTEAIRALERSTFLRGENDRAWRADFDFFIQPSSFQKLIEGSYDRPTH